MNTAARTLSIALLGSAAWCGPMSLSFTGALDNPRSIFQTNFVLSAMSSIRVQTWGFGGGTNAAGTAIPPGGFDPLVALFSGLPPAASILTESGSPLAVADTLTGFVGNCPPAGTRTIGAGAGSAVCGDDLLIASNLAAGVYTLLLTDANYIPLAIDPGPPLAALLSDGFTDLGGGAFQTCNATAAGTTCVRDTNNFAVDIVLLQGPSITPVPEPRSVSFAAIGAAVLILFAHRRRRNENA